MSPPNETHAYRALRELTELAHANTPYAGESAWLYALTWMAAGRLVATGRLPGAANLSELLLKTTWDQAPEDLIPAEARALLWGATSDSANEIALRSKALGVISALVDQRGTDGWNIMDATWHKSSSINTSPREAMALAPELCNLMFDVLNPPPQSTIWIPFDWTGQLILRAVKRRLKVIAAGPGNISTTHIRLLLAIEDTAPYMTPSVQFEVGRSPDGKRNVTAQYLIAVPPFNSKILPGMGFRQWEGHDPESTSIDGIYQRTGPVVQVELDRSDSWAIAAFWPRVEKRAIFLTSPSVLFARGQEQKLRQFLIAGSSPLSAVVALPNRQIGGTSLTPAMLVLDRNRQSETIQLIDAADMTTDVKSSMRYSRQFDSQKVKELLAERTEVPQQARNINHSEIAAQDFNLVPSRYFRRTLTESAGPRQPLGHLVSLVRAPVAAKEPTAITLQEVGFPELDQWRAIRPPFGKTTAVPVRRLSDYVLQEGDLIVSIKGTVGKSGILGPMPSVDVPSLVAHVLAGPFPEEPEKAPVVTSQSCIALRPNDKVLPAFLFMYLKSDEFRQQVDGLRVGAAIAHLSPSTLLQEIKVPVPALTEQKRYLEQYAELCEIEGSIASAQQRVEAIRATLFPTEHEEGVGHGSLLTKPLPN